jgi:protein-S-isoprenylcysteine O-methyltransferase Ste14
MRLTIIDAPSEWNRFADGSVEQRMLLAIGAELGAKLRPRPLLLENRQRVEVEGIDPEGRIVVQLVANQGTYKPSYRNKVMADLFKLLWLRTSMPSAERAVLVVTPLIVQALSGWVAFAAEDLGVEIYVFDGDRAAARRREGRES